MSPGFHPGLVGTETGPIPWSAAGGDDADRQTPVGEVRVAATVAALGLPVEGIGILIALDTLPDMFKTLLNVTSDMMVAVMTTPKEQLLTRNP